MKDPTPVMKRLLPLAVALAVGAGGYAALDAGIKAAAPPDVETFSPWVGSVEDPVAKLEAEPERSSAGGIFRANVVVAAADAPARVKAATPYEADGTGDQAEINAALAPGTSVLLWGSDFEVNGSIRLPAQSEVFGLGKHITRVSASTGWSPAAATGIFVLADGNADAVVVHDLWLQGRSRPNLSGIRLEMGPTADTSAWVDSPDAIHEAYNLQVGGFDNGSAFYVSGESNRAGKLHNIRAEDGNPVIFIGAADWNFWGGDIHGGVVGVHVGVQTQVSHVKSWFNSKYNWYIAGQRNILTNVQSQDSAGDGFYVAGGNNVFSGVESHSDSRGNPGEFAGLNIQGSGNSFAATVINDCEGPAIRWGSVNRVIGDFSLVGNPSREAGTRPSDAGSRIHVAA